MWETFTLPSSHTRILLIEDSPADTTVGRKLMESGESDFTVAEVRSVPEATLYIATHEVDVIVLALAPHSDLHDFDVLHLAHPEIPVVVLTGNYPVAPVTRVGSEQRQGIAALQQGAQDTLSKSELTPITLVRAIEHVGERYRRHRAEGALARVRGKLGSARRVQEHLFPDPPPGVQVEVWGAVLSRDMSGDFYDFLPLPEGRLLIVVGDVSGHGFDAALLMATARAYVRATVRMLEGQADVAQLMDILNELLIHDVGEERFVALSLAIVDLDRMQLTYASAGQPPACLLSQAGVALELTSPQNLPLGIQPGNSCRGSVHPLAEGDLLAFMTDGLLEARTADHEEFGTPRLLAELQEGRQLSAQDLVHQVYESIAAFTGPQRLRDDITLVLVKIPG